MKISSNENEPKRNLTLYLIEIEEWKYSKNKYSGNRARMLLFSLAFFQSIACVM